MFNSLYPIALKCPSEKTGMTFGNLIEDTDDKDCYGGYALQVEIRVINRQPFVWKEFIKFRLDGCDKDFSLHRYKLTAQEYNLYVLYFYIEERADVKKFLAENAEGYIKVINKKRVKSPHIVINVSLPIKL